MNSMELLFKGKVKAWVDITKHAKLSFASVHLSCLVFSNLLLLQFFVADAFCFLFKLKLLCLSNKYNSATKAWLAVISSEIYLSSNLTAILFYFKRITCSAVHMAISVVFHDYTCLAIVTNASDYKC